MAQEKAHSRECANESVLSLTWDEWIVKVFDEVFPTRPAQCAERCLAFWRAKKLQPHAQPVQDESTPHPNFFQQSNFHAGKAGWYHARESMGGGDWLEISNPDLYQKP